VLRWRGLEQVPGSWGRCVVTIGVFDGVHFGHQRIVRRAVERARELGVPAVVMTFDPHPSEVIRPGSHPAVLTTQRYRADLLEECGADVVLVVPFTPEFAKHSAEAFVHEVLVERLHVAAVVVGTNFRYGHKVTGDIASLTADGQRYGFTVEAVDLEGSGSTTWSSTYVRTCVAAGDVAAAAAALGREHRVEGVVVRGDGRGREIGYPTANVEPVAHSAVPADGIYAGRLLRRGEEHVAAISIGTNPTFAGTERRVEAFVLDFTGDLYGEHVALCFTARLRDTVRYDALEPLLEQMALDVARTRELVHPRE
jgi:riboflavin kinase / FMN adenylyltransferase